MPATAVAPATASEPQRRPASPDAPVRVRRPLARALTAVQCTCPEWCELDHAND